MWHKPSVFSLILYIPTQWSVMVVCGRASVGLGEVSLLQISRSTTSKVKREPIWSPESQNAPTDVGNNHDYWDFNHSLEVCPAADTSKPTRAYYNFFFFNRHAFAWVLDWTSHTMQSGGTVCRRTSVCSGKAPLYLNGQRLHGKGKTRTDLLCGLAGTRHRLLALNRAGRSRSIRRDVFPSVLQLYSPPIPFYIWIHLFYT